MATKQIQQYHCSFCTRPINLKYSPNLTLVFCSQECYIEYQKSDSTKLTIPLSLIELRFRTMFDLIDCLNNVSLSDKIRQNSGHGKANHLSKLTRKQVRFMVIYYYSNGTMKCKCCGENTIELLTLDHPNSDGNEKRRSGEHSAGETFYRWLLYNQYPVCLDVLCMNCNWGRAKHNGTCPHQNSKLINDSY